MDVLVCATITSFFQVDIVDKTLVVLDIDETVLQFPEIHENWWSDRRRHYENIFGSDFKGVDKMAYVEWLEHVKTTKPHHTDKDGLVDLFDRIKQTNSHVIFLTARHNHSEELTKNHLEHLGIENIPIYFTCNNSKGEHLNKIINESYSHVENVVFVDDMNHNIHDVCETLQDNVKCFKFVTTTVNQNE
jgi:hypothetical protein